MAKQAARLISLQEFESQTLSNRKAHEDDEKIKAIEEHINTCLTIFLAANRLQDSSLNEGDPLLKDLSQAVEKLKCTFKRYKTPLDIKN